MTEREISTNPGSEAATNRHARRSAPGRARPLAHTARAVRSPAPRSWAGPGCGSSGTTAQGSRSAATRPASSSSSWATPSHRGAAAWSPSARSSRTTPARPPQPATRLGLSCDLILTRAVDRTDEHYLRSGNLLLDRVLGRDRAHRGRCRCGLRPLRRAAWTPGADEKRAGRPLYGILPGGSDPVGTLGYVRGAGELAQQVAEHGLCVGRLVVAASTAGTAAGLVVGTSLADLETDVDVACVYHRRRDDRRELSGLVAWTASPSVPRSPRHGGGDVRSTSSARATGSPRRRHMRRSSCSPAPRACCSTRCTPARRSRSCSG